MVFFIFFFFFQAEDGIRDRTVTGVQTCALPICPRATIRSRSARCSAHRGSRRPRARRRPAWRRATSSSRSRRREIGRASCRERVEVSVGAVSLKKKKKRKRENRIHRTKYNKEGT